MPSCKCGKCTCDIEHIYKARLDEDILQDFLFGVNIDLYGHMRSSILSHEPLPSLERAYQMFLQEERLQRAAKLQSEHQKVRAMAEKTNISFPPYDKLGDNGSKSITTLSCTYCQRRGHDEANC